MQRVSKAVLGGWEISGIFLAQTGPFLTPITNGSTDPSGTNVDARANNRPDYSAGIDNYGNLPADQRSINGWFSDRTKFVTPASNIGRFGYVGPGQLVGPGTVTLSSKVQKRFFVGETKYLQIEGSFTNLLNHANFGIPALGINASNFGRITSTQGAEFGGGRTIQVGLRMAF